ncbi:DUF6797 domain-containing protein [Luteolibacter sp. LG18]|uniref:DUF6797 domain-containing protein n=1 Tax=Luteolibacter sp. LG18 TaxID=2819286 RepID=UPI002B296233|nr:hypothetical protein llg_01000 [Luteolibacter sp. LG18]
MQKPAYVIAAVAATLAPLHAAPEKSNWYEEMKIGPAWSNTFDDTFQGQKRLAAVKGILLELGDEKSHALFDTETLGLVNAYEGFVHWGGTPWTGAHAKLVALADETPVFNTARGTAKWADASGSFDDKRPIPGYGNFEHARFNGYFRSGSTIVLDYTVLGSRVLETVSAKDGTVTRAFEVAARKNDLTTIISDEAKPFTVAADGLSAKSGDGLTVAVKGGKLAADAKNPGRLLLRLAKGDKLAAQVAYARGSDPKPAAAPDFAALIKGGAPLWKEKIETVGTVSTDTKEPYATDVVTLPLDNPWKANLRFGGFDFLDDDTAVLSAWNGDVWTVKGLKGDWKKLTWQRIASGLFEPLGVKIVNGVIHVNGRDQITQLIDLNGDGEIDQFKTFNRDVYVTENFHEFAFDLQTDKQGNFYFSKAGPVKSGGRGFDKTLPNNGTIMKVSPDGKKLEVIATGLRAPGGVGVGPNGEISAGENEGSWEPACKISFAKASDLPVFFGCEPTRQELGKGKPYTEPLCFLPMDTDNSGASQVWVPQGAKFGVNPGEMLHLSYGQSSIYRVLPQQVGSRLQAGVSKLPIKLQSSAMRARFATDGSLYVLGFRGWQTNAANESGFQRVRYTGKPVPAPDKYEVTKTGVKLHFAQEIDPELAKDVASYSAQRWNYVRSSQYGSGEFSVDRPDKAAEEAAVNKESKNVKQRDTVKVTAAKLLSDNKTVELELEGMKPSMQLKVTYDLEDKDGNPIKSNVTSTVYQVP